MRLRELAGSRVRYGYRRLTVLLRREGWVVNAKRVYLLYREEALQVQMGKRTKRAAHTRVSFPEATRPNQRWSMDFVSDRLADRRWVRILTVIDQYTRECLCTYAGRSQTGEKVVAQIKRLVAVRGAPESITTDNGSESAGQAMDVWGSYKPKFDSISSGQAGPPPEWIYRKLQRPVTRRMFVTCPCCRNRLNMSSSMRYRYLQSASERSTPNGRHCVSLKPQSLWFITGGDRLSLKSCDNIALRIGF